ncbi:uncharacterized protein LOC107840340 [Capsicum annuum]|uniref:uncharacterized protein LOC107840340 n=1 Tax=Capsicum annuum TaxID=4072 RepID=UPI001FB125A3|nr:uncharacterized protein LOC107840340 [Capsicum annuum]
MHNKQLHDDRRLLNVKNLNIWGNSSLTKPLSGKLIRQSMKVPIHSAAATGVKSFINQQWEKSVGRGRYDRCKRGQPRASEASRAIKAAKTFMPENPYFFLILEKSGKELWGHIDGSDPSPTDPTKLGEWKIKDARVMTWILGSIDPLIVLNLRSYKTTKAMWDYLQKVYNQDHNTRSFQLEHEIANYSQGVHEQSKTEFLMKLQPGFESVRSNLMNRDPSPSLDICFKELLREVQHLFTQNAFKQENILTTAVAAQGKRKGRDMSRIRCYNCKQYGHIVSNYGKKFCNYCKQHRHIIKDCPTRPQNRRINAFQAEINGSTSDNSYATGTNQFPTLDKFLLLKWYNK